MSVERILKETKMSKKHFKKRWGKNVLKNKYYEGVKFCLKEKSLFF